MAFDTLPNKPTDNGQISPKHEPEVLTNKQKTKLFVGFVDNINPFKVTPKTLPNPPIDQILEKARDIIIERGWGQGTLWQSTTMYSHTRMPDPYRIHAIRKEERYNYCMLGAIQEAMGYADRGVGFDFDYAKVADYVGDILWSHSGNSLACIPKPPAESLGAKCIAVSRFNDAAYRTKEDVIHAFNFAIDKYRHEQKGFQQSW